MYVFDLLIQQRIIMQTNTSYLVYITLILQGDNNKVSTMQEQLSNTFISSVAWVYPGFAAHVPREVEMTEDQVQELRKDPMFAEQLDAQNQELRNQMMNQEDQIDEYPMFGIGASMGQQGKSTSKYPNAVQQLQSDQEDDYVIKDTDALVIAGKVQKEFSSLEIYIYEQDKNNLFVHHQIMLSSFPLSTQWLSLRLGTIQNQGKGNYAIVSSFLPEIQIWNLDLVQAVQPDLVLGGEIVQSSKKKPKKFTNNAKKYKEGSHSDSVLSLSLNITHNYILGSGSADSTVKIWDLNSAKNIYTCEHHKNKVNKVEWNPKDPTVIFSCSEDKTIAILDSRYPDDRIVHNLPKNQSVQSACWNTNSSSQIAYCTDAGNLYMFDGRNPSKHLFAVNAHPKSTINDIAISEKNLCYTCSEDGSVKIWNLENLEGPIAMKKPNCGKLFCVDVYNSQAGPVLGIGNGKGQLFVWQVCENAKVQEIWKK